MINQNTTLGQISMLVVISMFIKENSELQAVMNSQEDSLPMKESLSAQMRNIQKTYSPRPEL